MHFHNKMTVTLTMLRYRKRFIPFALLSMMLFRFPFWVNKSCSFWKLMGSGQNGAFDKTPDWQQWGILAVHRIDFAVQAPAIINTGNKGLYKDLYGSFIAKWIHFLGCETWTVFLEPIESHGSWDGKKVFGELPVKTNYGGKIAVLTRATIRLSRLKDFWRNVEPVAGQMANTKGLLLSLGIGEMPLVKQATFSIWETKEDMKQFAYQKKEHTAVIEKTRSEKWYNEDMFTRFKIIACNGTIRGVNPMAGKL